MLIFLLKCIASSPHINFPSRRQEFTTYGFHGGFVCRNWWKPSESGKLVDLGFLQVSFSWGSLSLSLSPQAQSLPGPLRTPRCHSSSPFLHTCRATPWPGFGHLEFRQSENHYNLALVVPHLSLPSPAAFNYLLDSRHGLSPPAKMGELSKDFSCLETFSTSQARWKTPQSQRSGHCTWSKETINVPTHL